MAGPRTGEVHWTPREREVLDLIARGRTNGEIAEELGITFGTAKWHVSELISKLGVDSREEVAAYWRRERSLRGRLAKAGVRLGAAPLLLKAAGAVAVGGVAVGAVAVGLLLATGNGEGTPQAVQTPATTDTPAMTPTPTETDGVTVVTATSMPSPTATPTPTEQQWYPWQPVGARTGDPTVDRILAAIENLDADTLVALTAYEEYPCEGPATQQPHPKRCPAGVAEGTILQGFFVAEVEGAYRRPEDMRDSWEVWTARWHSTLYGVFERTLDSGEREQILVFARPSPYEGRFDDVYLRAGKVVSVNWSNTNVPRDALFSPGAPGWLLPPLPVVPAEVVAFARDVAARVAAGDLAGIVAEGEPTAFRCGGEGEVVGFGKSSLCDGASAGELREGFLLTGHGSVRGPRGANDLVEELLRFSRERRWTLATIGCDAGDWKCQRFLVTFGWGDGTISRAMYLQFEARPGNRPVFVAAGLAGENVTDVVWAMLQGFATTTPLGQTHFYPVGP